MSEEFARIARLFRPIATRTPEALDLRDDAALLDPPSGKELVVTTDAIVAGVHFLPADPPELVAAKLLRVNCSDLAAMGARPYAYFLTMNLPDGLDESWLDSFAAGLAADLGLLGGALMGGDLTGTPGPITLSLTAIGTVPRGCALHRSGAQPGDELFVSGTIGDAALGLRLLEGTLILPEPAWRGYLIDRYRRPQPRLALGQRLHGLARAVMDVSDGLAADPGHLCRASGGVRAVIETANVPMSPAATAAIAANPSLFALALSGGDDYELLFTVPSDASGEVAELAAALHLPLTRIGWIEQQPAEETHGEPDASDADPAQLVRLVGAEGEPITLDHSGYRHFAPPLRELAEDGDPGDGEI